MITSKKELKEYIEQDRKANNRSGIRPKWLGDECWKFLLTMRHLDYAAYRYKKSKLHLLPYLYYLLRYRRMAVKLGYSIPYFAFGKGLALPHYGTIIINYACRFGENCKVHACVNIGATGGSKKAPQIGNNVYIGPGVQIVGDISIADGVCIGAGSVVVKSITEPNTTWAGCPAKKISDHSSVAHLSPMLAPLPDTSSR